MPSHSWGPYRRRAPSWQGYWSTCSCVPSWTPGCLNSSGSKGKGRSHLLQACPLHGLLYGTASYPAYLCTASHSQDTGWISPECRQVGEPSACALRLEFYHICCRGTSIHSVPPCALPAYGGWGTPSQTQGTPWHPSSLQATGTAPQPPHRPQPLLASLPLTGGLTPAASSS